MLRLTHTAEDTRVSMIQHRVFLTMMGHLFADEFWEKDIISVLLLDLYKQIGHGPPYVRARPGDESRMEKKNKKSVELVDFDLDPWFSSANL